MVRRWGGEPWCIQGDVTMPRNKDLKRLVRARMRKTGEAITDTLSSAAGCVGSAGLNFFEAVTMANLSPAPTATALGEPIIEAEDFRRRVR